MNNDDKPAYTNLRQFQKEHSEYVKGWRKGFTHGTGMTLVIATIAFAWMMYERGML